jgi:TonB-dependent starch-binding outer membrane protein SusC
MSLSPSSLMRLGLLGVFIAGCAHGGAPAQKGTAPTPDATLTSQDIHPAPNEPIEKVLQGRVSGVDVTQGADGIIVRIRGQSSVMGSDPLYVVDGQVIQAGPNGSLSGINPYDIDSIKVLKDPASLTMYGSRGANGVIVIKTKKANRPQ